MDIFLRLHLDAFSPQGLCIVSKALTFCWFFSSFKFNHLFLPLWVVKCFSYPFLSFELSTILFSENTKVPRIQKHNLWASNSILCREHGGVIFLIFWNIVDLQCWVSFRYTVICIRIFFYILFRYRLLQGIEYSSLCYTVGFCWLSNDI